MGEADDRFEREVERRVELRVQEAMYRRMVDDVRKIVNGLVVELEQFGRELRTHIEHHPSLTADEHTQVREFLGERRYFGKLRHSTVSLILFVITVVEGGVITLNFLTIHHK